MGLALPKSSAASVRRVQRIGPISVFVDANVWFSRTLRDWLGLLYVLPDDPPFVVHWSEDVLAELLYHLRKAHPAWPGHRISGIRDRLAGTFEAGRVESFEIDPTYRGRDVGDVHVHAAAVACGADVLLTFDVRDFVWDANSSPYEVMHPDDFLVLVDDFCPEIVTAAVDEIVTYWTRRGTSSDLVTALRKAACPQFADHVARRRPQHGHRLRIER